MSSVSHSENQLSIVLLGTVWPEIPHKSTMWPETPEIHLTMPWHPDSVTAHHYLQEELVTTHTYTKECTDRASRRCTRSNLSGPLEGSGTYLIALLILGKDNSLSDFISFLSDAWLCCLDWPQTSGLKWSSHLSLLNSWDPRHTQSHPIFSRLFKNHIIWLNVNII